MTITVKFFASLQEQLNMSTTTVETAETLEDVWQQATNHAERPSNTLVAKNLDYAHFSDPVASGDEVAFFPPVTGG
ncbi:MAG TPA: molybdopterin synthase sulfur carrier subunit [Gammaproteobacteria bacterium]|nr:molybdopterin synthase sulfur carrier subunit [Gammaproteobacteria bacterium]